MPTVAQLPQACREAAVHAALTCVVGAPHYFPPGWGPCSVCWGWLCLGVLLGAFLVGLLWGRSRARTARPPAWIEAASELLACVAAGGERELAELAASLGQSPTDLLCALLQQATESHAPHAPGPRAPAPPSWHARRSTHNLFSGHTTPATRTGTRAPGLFKSVRVTNAPRRDACDYRALATVQSPAPSCPGGAKQTYYYCYYGPAGVHAGPATVAATTAAISAAQPAQALQSPTHPAMAPCRICRHREPSGEEDGLCALRPLCSLPPYPSYGAGARTPAMAQCCNEPAAPGRG